VLPLPWFVFPSAVSGLLSAASVDSTDCIASLASLAVPALSDLPAVVIEESQISLDFAQKLSEYKGEQSSRTRKNNRCRENSPPMEETLHG
jgi:hypothetical protein